MFSDSRWKLLGWIIYISLMAISLWFTWGVLDKFAKQATAIRQYEDEIDMHPTIIICLGTDYQKFRITYTTYQSDGFTIEDEVALKIGGNILQNTGEKVNVTSIFTAFSQLCHAITTNRKVYETETKIKIFSPKRGILKSNSIYFVSERNSYGITTNDWRDGEPYSFSLTSGIMKDITLSVEKTINLNCSEDSFYEYVASKLSEDSFDKCNNTCLITSLPNDPYPICLNYNNWYSGINKGDSDCNFNIVNELIQNITNNDEHKKPCLTTQYYGSSHEWEISKYIAEFKYKFALPLKSKVYQEYLIIDSIGLVGSVGGTLGVFIGFSFNNLIICIIEYIQSLIERKLGRHKLSLKKMIKTILKYSEWIIYFFLMAIAILFVWGVIEKYFGQITGIKQSMERIKSHPTITICPFKDQCEVNSIQSTDVGR